MKKTYIKSLKIFSLVAFMMVGQSCEDVLKETVISGIGNDYINTPKGFEDAAKAAYSSLRNYYGTQQGLTVTEYGTDLYATGADGGYKGFHFYDAQLQPTVDYLAVIWDELYRGINTCNAVIERAPNVTGVTDAIKKQRIAEMKFLRAHYYFILFQQFGGVDLRLTETLAPTKITSRATPADMYKAIIADLETALPDLDSKIRSSDYGRATKAAAEHLLSRVYLTKGNSSVKAADDYAKAESYASNVIKNYGFKLLPDFASVFAQGAGEVNDEVIFAVQYTSDPLTTGGGNNLHLFFGMQYDVQAGMVRDIVNGRPFKRLRPTSYCLNTVFGDRVNDSRYKKTFKDTWTCNSPGTFTNVFDNSKKSVTFKTGDTTIFIPGYEMSSADRAKKPYQVLVPSRYDEALFPTLTKFFDPLRPDRTYEAGSRDFLCFRLADTYLMLAEAQLMQGKTKDATDNINVVRRRAAFAGKESAMLITQAQMNMEMIIEERGRELAGEQIRWMDLKRWGNLVERVQKYNPQAAPNVKAMHLVRPIPQTQIDRTEGGATAFPQNTGY
ncbi:RagB/SusD family nutrient uptake outer membrane protein [Arcicella sp. LKC2W]|uniref:RagB/SusD family nutrient uptake outer membrane protein n=1 Tax=Arcicella sp. LKC2W TaxID=2984198 RepID=UPI002B2054F3|nr:RagB/SusD family nutrient uptake outer membrane protein [Arcicella sp. LKC2W]MEA5457643.1 RagB/SusD family nutrient uptake outer membrane protein [Arcicella sp. LKC2W]